MSSDKAIPAKEFSERRTRAISKARELDLAGLLVCAKGGASLDRYGDVMYLTNHYSSFPYIPDFPGLWTGRGHSFLIMPVGDEPTLVVDIPSTESIQMPADRIVYVTEVIEKTAELLKKAFPKGRVGLIGGDAIPATISNAFEAAVPDVTWVPADKITAGLRMHKSPAEIEKLRAASALGSRMIAAMMEAAQPGATHGDIVAAGMQVLIPAGGILYNSFMASGKGGDNPTITRSNFPTWGAKQPLRSGEWFRAGISGVLDGYYFDLARCRPVGTDISNAQVDAFEAAISVIDECFDAIQPGRTAGSVAVAGFRRQDALGFPARGYFPGLGHGIGLGWDSPWLVVGDETIVEPGMVFCLEKTLTRDGYLGDCEETLVITESGPKRITDARLRYW